MENISKNKPCKDFVKKLKSGSQVILLRHAETKYNELKKGLLSREHTEEDILRIKTNLDNWDTSLTQFGMQQWEITAEVVSKLKVEIVLVSPMKRTMQTAYNVFKNHPNFNNIEFVVVPKLKELLGSVADVPKDLLRTINQFKDKFPNFNCSLIQDYNDMRHFYLEDIKDDFAKKILLEKSREIEDPSKSNSHDMLVEYIEYWFPRKPESNRSLLKRISKVKKYIHTLLQSKFNSSSSKILSDDSKIVVVTHGIVGKFWTGKWDKPLDEYDEIPMPSKYKDLKNCELYVDNKNFPRSKPIFH